VAESPLAQFEVARLVPLRIGGVDASFTNSSLLMVIAVTLVTAFLVLATRRSALVPGRWQSAAELTYELVANMVRANCGTAGMAYFPWIFSIFMFVLAGNFLGMVPWSFTFTSQIIVTFALALMIFLTVTIIALVRHGFGFFSLFFPHGAPIWLAPLIIPIEVLSYLSRPCSLAIRLFANMLAGHILLQVFGGFVIMLGILGVVPLVVTILVMFLEFLVAGLQAYVFAVLACIYLKDALELH
jgi:F-type H+-transporting ATPase subunit a